MVRQVPMDTLTDSSNWSILEAQFQATLSQVGGEEASLSVHGLVRLTGAPAAVQAALPLRLRRAGHVRVLLDGREVGSTSLQLELPSLHRIAQDGNAVLTVTEEQPRSIYKYCGAKFPLVSVHESENALAFDFTF